jgi:radical SAM protein with 4Fe4S-binding SPASM domain
MEPAELQAFATELVANTRDYIYIRPEDGLFILRPNRVHHLNRTALALLSRLYDHGGTINAEEAVRAVAAEFSVDEARVRADLEKLLISVAALLRDDVCGAPAIREIPFGSHKRDLPVLSEIALTDRCQNKCLFCYAESPNRGAQVREMTTDEVKTVIDRIYDDAHCPTVSFTGGEPTLREDLPELVRYAKSKGMRVNLITNGLKCSDSAYVAGLREAGLDSAQVSLEGPTPQVHDLVVRHPGAFEHTTKAVHVLRAAGIHTHTNTTICGSNRAHLTELVDYIADELHSEYFSMNVMISTGTALKHSEEQVTYTELGGLIEQLQGRAAQKAVKLVWYSPTPYCLFNPVTHGLGSKSCACIDGLLSVAPDGELLPCSSYECGIGNLLSRPFSELWFSKQALYWRQKRFLPPVCQRCDIKHICCGACPLYWHAHGGFEELEATGRRSRWLDDARWQVEHRLFGQARGVGLR